MPLLVALAAVVLAGCVGQTGQDRSSPPVDIADSPLRLDARPRAGARPCAPGEYELRVAPGRRALMRVTPPRRGRQAVLLVALHGAGSGGAPGGLYAFRGAWDVPGLVIVAPAAAGTAWTLDATDVRFVDGALQRAFARCRVDARRVAVGGFSSGAGMALWLGLTNGDLFRGVIAMSGGGALPDERTGKPRVFVAHGTLDGVIPVSVGGDAIVRDLRGQGYDVTYRRFRGGHRVVPAIARAAVLSTLIR
jgi:phospholipase/carboxylesterase